LAHKTVRVPVSLHSTGVKTETGTRLGLAHKTVRVPVSLPAVAASLLLLGLVAALASGVFKVTTPNGVIVLENVTQDAVAEVVGDRNIGSPDTRARPSGTTARPRWGRASAHTGRLWRASMQGKDFAVERQCAGRRHSVSSMSYELEWGSTLNFNMVWLGSLYLGETKFLTFTFLGWFRMGMPPGVRSSSPTSVRLITTR
jgi:hypothetical protein